MKNNSNQGRWDHLLKEISSPQISAPLPPQTMNPLPIEDEIQVSNTDIASTTTETVYSVSELNRVIKKQLEGQFEVLWVQGEISNFKAHTSGHHYFSLKDDKSQINAVMFKGFNSKLRFRPESGMEVLVRGKMSVYEPRGNYQIFCEHMEPVGAGALQKAFEQLKEKLNKEGLFASDRKKPIPAYPLKIGVVTSPTGAAIQDILNVLRRRSKRVQVILIPARVQGEGSAQEVVRGIELANKVKDFDVLIVGRGGGSIEDLWCFNEEIVARAIAASRIPIISAVGHEIDFTIADFVADLRAPTPSAAAELVAKSEIELIDKINFFSQSLRLLCEQLIADKKRQLNYFQKGLIDPRKYVQDSILRLDDWSQRLQQVTQNRFDKLQLRIEFYQKRLVNPQLLIEKKKLRLENLLKISLLSVQKRIERKQAVTLRMMGLLDSLSPLRVIERGYAIVRDQTQVIQSLLQVKEKQIQVELRDGIIVAEVIKTKAKEKK